MGSGRVDDGFERRRSIGSWIQYQRRKRFAEISDEAKRLGVRASVLAAIERGTFLGELPEGLRADAALAGQAFVTLDAMSRGARSRSHEVMWTRGGEVR
jgi:dihydropteroate synthase